MRHSSPFDRVMPGSRDHSERMKLVIAGIVVLGIILLILLLPPVSILSRGQEQSPSGQAIGARARTKLPNLPEGYQPLSRLYDISAPKHARGPALITVNLEAPTTDGRNLSLYTYEDGRWQRIASVRLVENGLAAQAEVAEIPANVAILRRVGVASQLAGWLPPRAQPYPNVLGALSILSPADFAPGSDGSVTGEPSPRPQGPFQVIPVIRAATAADIEAVNNILASPDLRPKHSEQVLRLVDTNKYDGIEIDYRDINPARAREFSAFLSVLGDQLHRSGRQLVVTAPLPVLRGNDWDSGAYNWAEIAKVADRIKLLPERDGDRYYRRMEDVFAYLTKQVDPNKLLPVISPYSYEKGGEGYRPLTTVDALAILSTPMVNGGTEVPPGGTANILAPNFDRERGATGPRWDDDAAAVVFDYPGQGGVRRVWIENVFSLGFKLQLVKRYKLGGIALEDITKDSGLAELWPSLQTFLESGSPQLLRPNEVLLQPQWTASSGSLNPGNRVSVTWRAPEQPGSYDITLIASDGVIRVGQRVTFTVRTPGLSPTPSPVPGLTPSPARSPTPVATPAR